MRYHRDMRAALLVLFLSLLLAGQQTAAQKARSEAFFQQRERLQTQARAAFERERAREKAGDCQNANNTRELNACFGGEVETSTANYQAYANALRAMLAQENPFGESNGTGPTGRALTQKELLANFDQAEAAWAKYHDALCAASAGLYQGGTIVTVKLESCNLMALRSHMKEMSAVFGEYLSH